MVRLNAAIRIAVHWLYQGNHRSHIYQCYRQAKLDPETGKKLLLTVILAVSQQIRHFWSSKQHQKVHFFCDRSHLMSWAEPTWPTLTLTGRLTSLTVLNAPPVPDSVAGYAMSIQVGKSSGCYLPVKCSGTQEQRHCLVCPCWKQLHGTGACAWA